LLNKSIEPTEPPANDLRHRQIRFDILVKFNDGELANVEMTMNPGKDEPQRFEYYTARLFVNQNIRGADRKYWNLKPVYHLSFLHRNVYRDEEWLHRFMYYDPQREMKMGGRTEIMTVELRKLEKANEVTVKQRGLREAWALFLMHYSEKGKSGMIQELIRMDEGIAAADHVACGFTKSELEGLAQIARDKVELDAQSRLAWAKEAAQKKARKKGREEGIAIGLKKAQEQKLAAMKETARKLRDMGLELGQIERATGLSAAEMAPLWSAQ